MRIRQALRREAIMQIALDMFREVGFDAASMSQIAARVGGSKATLYNYFASKEDLLLAAMMDKAKKNADNFEALLQESGELPTQLERFVRSLLAIMQTCEIVQILRVAISVGNTSTIGRKFYELSITDFWEKVANILSEAISKGTLRQEDPQQMVLLLRSLCQADLLQSLMGDDTQLNDAELDQRAKTTVSLFLKVYGT